MRRIYFAHVDDLGILCVDDVTMYTLDGPSQEAKAMELATSYPDIIYFVVDLADPEFRVPVSRNGVS